VTAQRWAPAAEPTPEKKESEAKGPIWVKCPRFDVPPVLQAALRVERASILRGQATLRSRGEMTPTVVLCPNEEGIDSEVRTTRQLTPDSPILVFGSTADPKLAEEALRAGANGFVYAGMGPERIARIISLASESEVLIPRELLGELVGLRLFLKMPKILEDP
jgi:DNA-binding NarL/FixJ family response regulator